jgi:hypothetical protein
MFLKKYRVPNVGMKKALLSIVRNGIRFMSNKDARLLSQHLLGVLLVGINATWTFGVFVKMVISLEELRNFMEWIVPFNTAVKKI